METVAPDTAAAAEDSVHRLGESDREPLQPARERAAVGRLDDEMDVIALDGELQEPKAAAGGVPEAPAERGEDAFPAEGWQPLARTEGHVERMACLMSGPHAMGDASPGSGRSAAGAGTPSAPGAVGELKLRRLSCHLERAIIAEC